MDAIASAVADSVRRAILERLRGGVLSANEIANGFDISRPAVSRHLRVLRECGLVVDETRGRQRFYRLDLSALAPLEAWIGGLRAERWERALDALETEVYRARRERREAPREHPTGEERTA